MKYIFTLSGNSERFTKDGFITKSLIKINNRNVIEYVLDMFPNIDYSDVIFIVNENDVNEHNIDYVLHGLFPGSHVAVISAHRKGPVESILRIEEKILDGEPYVITYCDLTHKWNFEDFVKKLNDTKCDGCLVTHTGLHPHRMRNINFAHLKTNGESVFEVKEKGCYTNNPVNEYASSGIYYFKTGKLLKYYFHKIIENKENINGEYYVTLVYNQMIRDGLSIIHYPTDNYVCLGTPHDLISFKYWKTLIDNNFSDEEIDFVKNYWKKYDTD
jgi:NDP-sugar pyrophosphorylase family protein